MNIHTDTADMAEKPAEEFTLLDAVDGLGKVKSLVELIFMAAFDLDDRQANAIQNGVMNIQNEIDDIRDSLRALRVGGVK